MIAQQPFGLKATIARCIWLVRSLCILILCMACSRGSTQIGPSGRPNILLLVADDLGYSDLGCFGGEIATPHIDGLAARGIRFSNFHTAPMCSPTRAMLLSGTYNHIAGIGRQNLETTVPGYEGHLSNRIIPLPALLKKAGYHTYMAGKWHLGSQPGENAPAKGFERSFVLMEGVGNHYNGEGIFKGGPSNYQEDGQPVPWPKGRYDTDLYTDKLISYIEESRADRQPFFAYAAYTSPHWPLQVDEAFRAKYHGLYDQGYEALRSRRMANLKQLGLVPRDAELPAYTPGVRPWAELSAAEQKREARKMELYAGMVDNLDGNIGRLLAYLSKSGLLDNTLVVFMSDNGAAGEDYFNTEGIRSQLNGLYHNTFDNMGHATSLVSYGPGWAEAGSAPFRYFKEYTTRGGMVAPLILAGPMVSRQDTVCHSTVTVMDLAPTFYELSGISYPETWEGHRVYPLKGASLLSYPGGITAGIHPPDYGFGMEHTGYTMYQKGDWKINNMAYPFNEANFELFNLAADGAEQRDLRSENPSKFKELLEEWRDYADEAGVRFPR